MEGKPYTRTGDIIIAVNPFQWFTELYTEKKRVYYSNRLVWEATGDDPRDGMEPHVYEVSALSYKGLAGKFCCLDCQAKLVLLIFGELSFLKLTKLFNNNYIAFHSRENGSVDFSIW